MPIREYWGEMLIIEADLDTLNLPCLYNEDLWYNGDEDEDAIDPGLSYLRNFPNPFNPSTNISFAIPEAGLVELTVFNIKGQLIKILIKEELERGEFSIDWQGEDAQGNKCGSGIYFYQLKRDGKLQSVRRCLLLK